jgi:CheY-like chemotaxis protein
MSLARDILICDDEPDLVDALGEYLENFDWKVRTANSATQALAMMQTGPRPSLLLTDVRMPDMDGSELIRRAGNDLPPDLRPLAMVAMTGHKNESNADDLRQAGASEVLFKPIELDLLRRTLDTLLTGARAAKATQS